MSLRQINRVYAVLGIIYSKDKYPSKFSFWSHTRLLLTNKTLKKITEDVLMRCWVIVYDHDVKLAGYFQNLVGQCSMTDCYFQHWLFLLIELVCWCWCYWCFFLADVTDSTFQGKILHEPQPYVPSNPIHESDIEKLLSIESESMESSWSRVKKTKEAEVWRRESNEDGYPPITKVTLS